VLNFTIPVAPPTTGIPFLSSYHLLTYNGYFNINTAVASNTNEVQSVLTYVPEACTITKFYATSQPTSLPQPVTIVLRQGSSVANMLNTVGTPNAQGQPTPGAACTIGAGQTKCSATGISVPITAFNFIDLYISGGTSTPTPIYVAFGCDAS
jgi:hypothetical protein